MVCAISALSTFKSPRGAVELPGDLVTRSVWGTRSDWFFGDRQMPEAFSPGSHAGEAAEGNDPFDDFEDDDFDDEFDDDFEEDWEDDLTEDDEFPDTFGGAEPEEEVAEPGVDAPFADDPDFDDA